MPQRAPVRGDDEQNGLHSEQDRKRGVGMALYECHESVHGLRRSVRHSPEGPGGLPLTEQTL